MGRAAVAQRLVGQQVGRREQPQRRRRRVSHGRAGRATRRACWRWRTRCRRRRRTLTQACCAVQRSILRPPPAVKRIRLSRSDERIRQNTSCAPRRPRRCWPWQSSGRPGLQRRGRSCATRSVGNNGESHGTVARYGVSQCSSPARKPASGPAKPGRGVRPHRRAEGLVVGEVAVPR